MREGILKKTEMMDTQATKRRLAGERKRKVVWEADDLAPGRGRASQPLVPPATCYPIPISGAQPNSCDLQGSSSSGRNNGSPFADFASADGVQVYSASACVPIRCLDELAANVGYRSRALALPARTSERKVS